MRTEKAERPTPNLQRPIEKEVRDLFEQFVVPSYARFDLENCVCHARVAAVEGRYFWRWVGHLPECAGQ